MSSTLFLPMFRELVPEGLKFGANYEVEFESHSLWYEASLTMTAHAVMNGIRTEYHVFQHIPNEVRETLTKLGVNVKKSEEENLLRILDTYTLTTGLGVPQGSGEGRAPYETQSFNLSDWSIATARVIKEGAPDAEKKWLHIDDNTSVLNQYSDEKSIVDIWRTRTIPYARIRELVMFHSLVTGVASEAFYRQFEQLCDGIIDFKSQEKEGRIVQLVRVRMMRGKTYESQWHELQLLANGEVKLAE